MMGWGTATPLVRALTIAVFGIVAAIYAIASYRPANPQYPVLVFASIGLGAIAALIVLRTGNLVTHPRTREEVGFWLSRQPYTGNNRVVMLQFVITVAVGVMALVNLFAWARHGGGWVAATSCLTFSAVMIYPYIRYRIERGQWPD